jgi:hypothetical protein
VRLVAADVCVAKRGQWLIPLLALIAGSVVAEVFSGFQGFFGSLAVSDPARLADALRWFLQVHAHSWGYLSGLILILLVVDLFDGKPELLSCFRRGLLWGIAAAALVTLAQFFGIR